MRRPTTIRLAKLLAIAASGIVVAGAHAQGSDYPNREIRSICAFAAGSGADILVRYFSDRLAKISGRPVLVENRPGAQGALATELAAKAKPDGYTINITAPGSTLALAPHMFKQLNFDPHKDFAPVTTLSRLSFAIAVDAAKPIKTIPELVEFLKKKPGHGAYGSGSNSGQITGELFKTMAGLETQYVNYKASIQAVTDLVGGQTDFITYDMPFLSTQIRAGRLRVLALSSAQRSGTFPDIPTMAELGYTGFDVTPWWGVLVPAATPKPIVDKLAGWFNEIVASPETKEFLGKVASDVFPGTPESMAALLKTEFERWGRYAKVAKIQPQ